MRHGIFDKTPKGREEIATRKYSLPPRLRTLLVLADGKQSGEELLRKVSGIGLNEDSIAELLNLGFIQPVSAEQPVVASVIAAGTGAGQDDNNVSSIATVTDSRAQFLAIYQFYTETIKSTIGLRGYALQLKVEKAASVDEFRALREPYLEAVLKTKGSEIARTLRTRLDRLFQMDEMPAGTVAGNKVAAE